ncbi:hypothetical protein AVEN_94859-1 [Araneus ventricosus]|uniref:Uncharacterized protein n=1 Tax=Araneus ventricosus TaxID=182803 RepID=A0A4Y2W4Y8_ARAVE|nr:hypothetical protein AVEN_94859-1 [Araneus ventricosus]
MRPMHWSSNFTRFQQQEEIKPSWREHLVFIRASEAEAKALKSISTHRLWRQNFAVHEEIKNEKKCRNSIGEFHPPVAREKQYYSSVIASTMLLLELLLVLNRVTKENKWRR